MTDAALSPEEQLIEDIASFTHDPLGYALYAFPWGEDGTELAHASFFYNITQPHTCFKQNMLPMC